MRVVFISGRYLRAGRHRRWAGVFPTARHAELAAAFAGRGHTPVLLADPDVHLPLDIARLVWRHDPDAVVVCRDSIPAIVVELLGASRVPMVMTTGDSAPTDGAVHQADVPTLLAAVGADPGAPAGVVPSGVVAPALRAEVGVELAHAGPDGAGRPNAAAAVARSLAAARLHGADSPHPVRLSGLEALAAPDALALVAAVADVLGDGPVRASLPLRARDAGEDMAREVARLVSSVALVVDDGDDVAALGQAIGTLEQAGIEPTVVARFGDDIDLVEDVIDIVLSSGVELSYTWAEGTDLGVLGDGESVLRQTGSTSLTEEAAIGPVRPLAALLSGRFDAHPVAAGVEAILVTGDAPAAAVASAGLRTEVFSTSDWSGPGRLWHLEGAEADGEALAGDGEVGVDGSRFEVCGYREGRHVTPFESLVLRFSDLDDVEAFLADADVARQDGRFPNALLSGFTLLADVCAWGEAGACGSGQLRRAACSDGHHIRTAPHGPIAGRIDQSWTDLARSARQLQAEAKRRRGCRECPIASLCSKDLCLSSLIGDEQYCRQRRARPWLVGYLDAIDAIRRLRRDPAQVVPRVGGFGGVLHRDLAGCSWPDRPAVILMEWRGGFYGYVPQGAQAFRLTPDAAFIAEALLVHPAPAGAVESRFGLPGDNAAAAMAQVASLLGRRGAVVDGVTASFSKRARS